MLDHFSADWIGFALSELRSLGLDVRTVSRPLIFSCKSVILSSLSFISFFILKNKKIKPNQNRSFK